VSVTEDVPALRPHRPSPPTWLPAALRIPLGDLTEIGVDLVEGELTVRHLGLVVAGGEHPLGLVREYRGPRRSKGRDEEDFGPGGSFTTGQGVRQERAEAAVRLVDGRGRSTVLHRDAEDRLVELTAHGETLRIPYDGADAVGAIDWSGPHRSARIQIACANGRTTVRGPGPGHSVHVFDAHGRTGTRTDVPWDSSTRSAPSSPAPGTNGAARPASCERLGR
jgi:hypothetical protein